MVIKDDNLPYNVQMFKAFIHSDDKVTFHMQILLINSLNACYWSYCEQFISMFLSFLFRPHNS